MLSAVQPFHKLGHLPITSVKVVCLRLKNLAIFTRNLLFIPLNELAIYILHRPTWAVTIPSRCPSSRPEIGAIILRTFLYKDMPSRRTRIISHTPPAQQFPFNAHTAENKDNEYNAY